MKELKDIKPIVEVSDDSFILFMVLVSIVILLIGLGYWQISRSRRISDKKSALIKLKNIDYSNSKEVAYTFKRHAKFLSHEDNTKEYNQINKKLEQYKYKKQVAEIDPSLMRQIKDFINA